MLTRLICMSIAAVYFLAPQQTFGQKMPSGKWWTNPQVIKRLDLKKNEINRLEKNYVQSRRRLLELKHQVEKERFELENMLENRAMDDQAVQQQLQRLERARTELSTERMAFIVQIRKIIGVDRYRQLQSLYKQSRESRKSPRP